MFHQRYLLSNTTKYSAHKWLLIVIPHYRVGVNW